MLFVSLPKMIYGFNAIPIKTLVDFYTDTEKGSLKFIWKCKGTRITKPFFKKKRTNEGFTLFDFKFGTKLNIKI